MFLDILITFLWSISPLGEARAGIPIGIERKLPILLVFFKENKKLEKMMIKELK